MKHRKFHKPNTFIHLQDGDCISGSWCLMFLVTWGEQKECTRCGPSNSSAPPCCPQPCTTWAHTWSCSVPLSGPTVSQSEHLHSNAVLGTADWPARATTSQGRHGHQPLWASQAWLATRLYSSQILPWEMGQQQEFHICLGLAVFWYCFLLLALRKVTTKHQIAILVKVY